MINPTKLFQMKALWDRFSVNHPKFPKFLAALAQSPVGEGAVIEVKVTYPNGDEIASNLRLTEDDMELFRSLREFSMSE